MGRKQMRANNKMIFAIDERLYGATFGIILSMSSIKLDTSLEPAPTLVRLVWF